MQPREADVLRQGRLKIVRQLGAGGMGVVFEAIDNEHQTRVAVKRLNLQTGEGLHRFKNEFRALHDLEHPNLTRLGELFEEDGAWYFTMELIEGRDFVSNVRPCHGSIAETLGDPNLTTSERKALQQAPRETSEVVPIEPRSPFDEHKVRASLRQLVEAVDFLHRAGKVHRDIKPSNIVVTKEGRVVLLDFGIVRPIDSTEGSVTQSNAIIGTAAYMAPESGHCSVVGPAADWYAVGVVLYEVLTGRVPFSGRALAVLERKQTIVPSRPQELVPSVPADLDALCMGLLCIDPASRLSGDQVRARVASWVSHPDTKTASAPSHAPAQLFVGREAELAELMKAYDTTRQRDSAVVVIVEGESGVGKSALVRQFCNRVRAAGTGAVILDGRCYERESLPYKAIDGVVDSLSRFMMRLDYTEAAVLLPTRPELLADAFPSLRLVKAVQDAPSLQKQTPLDPQEQRSRLFAAMRELMTRLADRRSVIIVVDDLQWADADGLAMLGESVRPPEAPPLLLIGTIRSGMALGTGGRAAGRGDVFPADTRRVKLGRLRREDARELAALLAEDGPDEIRATVEQLAGEAEGHPLFLYELVRHAVSHGYSRGERLRLEEMLLARVAAMPPACKTILELVAVAGGPIEQSVVAAAAPISPSEFSSALRILQAGKLVSTAGSRINDSVQPYHDRVRETVAGDLQSDLRQDHHRKLASAMAELTPHRHQRLVVHWRAAGRPDLAAEHAVSAASDADAALAFDQAAEFYRLALELRPPNDASLPGIRAKLAHALANAGRGADAAEAYLLAVDERDREKALELKRRASEEYLKSGHIDKGLAVVRAVLLAVGLGLPRTPLQALLSMLLRRILLQIRGLSFRERPANQIPPATLARIDIYWSAATSLSLVDVIRATDFNVRALLLGLRAGEPDRLARAFAMEALFVATGGGASRRRTERLLETTSRLAHRIDEPLPLAWNQVAHGIANYYVGRFRDSLQHLETCETILREQCKGVAWNIDTTRLYLLSALGYLGRIAEIARRVPQYTAEALDRGDYYCSTNLQLGRLNVAWLVADDVDLARQMVRDAVARWSQAGFHTQHWYELMAEAQLDLYCGDGHSAFMRMERRWRELKRSLLLRVQFARVEALHLRARCALAASEQDAARKADLLALAERYARRVLRERMDWSNPLAELILAGVLARRGDDEGARQRLGAAAKGFEAAEMLLLATVAKRRLGRLVGGEAGQALVQAADQWMTQQSIRNPDRWTAMLAPGFGDG